MGNKEENVLYALTQKELIGESLNIHQKLLHNTINSIHECISITDMNDIIIYVNKAFIETYGYSEEELIGKSIYLVRSENLNDSANSSINKKTIDGGWQGEIYNKKKDGTVFLIHLRTSIVKDDHNNPIALVGIAEDLTEKIIARQVLKEAEDKYHNLFWELKDAVYESTPDGKFIDLNPSAMELFGIKDKSKISDDINAASFYLNPGDREKFKLVLEREGSVTNYEIEIKNRKGEILTVLETASVVKDSSGNIKSYNGILRDITETKRQEDKFKQYIRDIAEANKRLYESEIELKKLNASKDKLFSIIAHDLRSPFTSLIGLSDFLLEDIEDFSKDEIKNFVIKINESARNVFKLLENLLQWSKLQTGGLEFYPVKFDMYTVVIEAVNLLGNNAAQKSIKLINEMKKELFVVGDYNMVFSLVQNLISNAIKFSNADGNVRISYEFDDDYIYTKVEDSGIGMNNKDLLKLFRIDTHHTTLGTANEKGSGLGLVLCKELVEQNGGVINVKSELGKGTTFIFSLPKSKE
ncbi:MAG: PAS domain-containing sensor histidine kinase [Bacteroidetes bacterium]|nr:PAS domain-containing sensor histidine kinase [Bacteroidota bacterium]